MQVASDLPGRPMLAVVPPMNFVDSICFEHRFVLGPRRQQHKTNVLFKKPTRGICQEELIEESGLGEKLSCSLQDSGPEVPTAKPQKSNALGRKLSCSLQVSAGGVACLAGAELAGYDLRIRGASAGTAGNKLEGGGAISADCPDRPGGKRGRFRFCGGGNLANDGADSLGLHMRSDGDGNGKVETAVDNKGIGDHSSGKFRPESGSSASGAR